jgi:hypothetical protein
MVEVIPVSDPNAATMSQKIVQYQAVLQLAQQAPQLYDLAYLHRQMLEVLGIHNAQKLVPMEDDELPKDPISENIAAVKGKPMKAFLSQDHDAHIAAHQAFMQDPRVMQMIGQNPQANMIMASLQAHMAEHLGYQYRAQVEQQMGVSLPPPDQKLPEEVEVQLSRLIAQASQQLLQVHNKEAAQQKAQQQSQDPLIQMQQAQLKIDQDDLARKAKKDNDELVIKQQQLQLEKDKVLSQQVTEKMRLDADLQKTYLSTSSKHTLESNKINKDVFIASTRNKGSR